MNSQCSRGRLVKYSRFLGLYSKNCSQIKGDGVSPNRIQQRSPGGDSTLVSSGIYG